MIALSRKQPSMRLVTKSVSCLWMPRVDMQWWFALMHHADALRLQHVSNGVGDLRRHLFLDL